MNYKNGKKQKNVYKSYPRMTFFSLHTPLLSAVFRHETALTLKIGYDHNAFELFKIHEWLNIGIN